MPSSVIEVRFRYTPDEETRLLEAVHAALVDAFRIRPEHRNVTLIVHEPHRFIGRPDCPAPERLTNVTVHALPGRSVAAKRRLYRRITTAFAELGIPPACVLIRLVEQPAENFGVRGGQALCDVDLGYPVDI